MTNVSHRCWVVRTDKANRSLLLSELNAGRLRQGWGYDPSQDLRLIQAKTSQGAKSSDRLTDLQRQALPNLRMLSTSDGGVRTGDWILVPNLPEMGSFLIVEVIGDYRYEMFELSATEDVNDLGRDYGHILPVRLLTPRGLNKFAEGVPAEIRRTLRTVSRMWNVDKYCDALHHVIDAQNGGTDLSIAQSGSERVRTARDAAVKHVATELRRRLECELTARFKAAEWEEPVMTALASLYPEAEVRRVAGPNEHGADVLLTIPNHFGGLNWLVPVQVKDHIGETGSDSIMKQLRDAYGYYQKDGRILALVVMTTAEKVSSSFDRSIAVLSTELGVPIELVGRKKMMWLLAEGLLREVEVSIEEEAANGASLIDLE